jgi:hypothetical protein
MSGFEAGFHMTGKGGTLIQGWNEVTRIGTWTAEPKTLSNGKTGLRLTVHKHEPDAYWFDYCDPDEPMSLEIKIGKQEVTKPASILSKEPLVIEAWQPDPEEED